MATIPFDANTSTALDAYITRQFPDAGTSDEIRTGVALAIWAEGRREVDLTAYASQLAALAAQVGITPGQQAVARAMPSGEFRYYDVDAVHDRSIPDLEPFTGRLSMARVTLPQTNREVHDFRTGIGTVGIRDHLYRSVEELKQTYQSCSGSVPGPQAPDTEQADHCNKISADATLGCAACAGVSYCGWKQTTSPTDGTCHYVAKKPSSDQTLVTDPQQCPKPPE